MFDALATSLWKHMDGMSLYLVLAAVAATYISFNVVYSVYDVYFGPLSKFPGPKVRAFSRLPAIFTAISGGDVVEHSALHAEFGPCVRTGPRELSYASGATAWRDIYGFKKSQEPHLAKHPKDYNTPYNQVHSISTAPAASHSRQRKILSHSFADKTLKDFEPMLKQWVAKLKDKLAEKSGEEVDLVKYYNCTTFDVMGGLTFGEDLQNLENGEYSDWVVTIFSSIKKTTILRAVRKISVILDQAVSQLFLNSPKFRKTLAEHWKYSQERVDRRLSRTPDRPDLWTKIIAKNNTSAGLTLDENHSNGSIFMVAGTETTATALSGTTYYLLRNPECLRMLTSEIREAHATFGDMTLDSLQRLKYLHAVLQEGLRMYPPVPSKLCRIVPAGGAIIEGKWIPAGTSVGVHQLSTYLSESNFKNAHEFHPERWLGHEEYANDHLDALEPFSVGPRNCIGKNLAWHEMRLILATVLWHFDLRLSEESLNWNDQKVYFLWEKRPLVVRAVPRVC